MENFIFCAVCRSNMITNLFILSARIEQNTLVSSAIQFLVIFLSVFFNRIACRKAFLYLSNFLCFNQPKKLSFFSCMKS